MAMMRAVVVDGRARGRLAVREVEAPKPGPAEALVRVKAISLNRGEVRRAQTEPAGAMTGWDLAGIVEVPAASGSGPTAGQRVVGLLPSQAWAELAPVPVQALAVLPNNVSFEQAATLPVAGLTALHALYKGGNLLGRNVLITGASGGVGHLAVQLAVEAGARVVGLVRQQAHVAAVRKAGAHEVVADESGEAARALGPYHLVLESVGGDVLAATLTMLVQGGTCVHYGVSSGQPATINSSAFFRVGRVSLYGLYLFTELAHEPAGVGLAALCALVANGRLRPLIEIEAPWTQVGEVAQQLLDRRYAGKAVLRVE
jgi:NADPH:quinone reductase